MTPFTLSWRPDVLGLPYEATTLDLVTDEDGPTIATLVRRRASEPAHRAVLYVHGFNDYFFQRHLADFYVSHGFDFYALDLRNYGRSLLAHQRPNFTRSLDVYDQELDRAVEIIRHLDDHDTLLVNGHSTGGLITALWANRRRNDGVVDALFLNSPYFENNVAAPVRTIGSFVVPLVARINGDLIIPTPFSTLYIESIHESLRGEWAFDFAWKPRGGFPVRAAWLAAILRGHKQIARNLALEIPVLVMSARDSFSPKKWDDRIMASDTVLNGDRIAMLGGRLGSNITAIRVDGGMHDLVLSAGPVRSKVFADLERWLRLALPVVS